MSATCSARLQLLASVDRQDDTGSYAPGLVYSDSYVNGTAAGQCDVVYERELSVVSGSPLTLNLHDGSLAQTNGDAAVFAKLVLFVLRNLSVTTGQKLLVGNATHPLAIMESGSSVVGVGPGAALVKNAPIDPITVTASTTDQLKIDAASGTASFLLLMVGRSA